MEEYAIQKEAQKVIDDLKPWETDIGMCPVFQKECWQVQRCASFVPPKTSSRINKDQHTWIIQPAHCLSPLVTGYIVHEQI